MAELKLGKYMKCHYVDPKYPKTTACGFLTDTRTPLGTTEDLYLVTCRRCKCVLVNDDNKDVAITKDSLDGLWDQFMLDAAGRRAQREANRAKFESLGAPLDVLSEQDRENIRALTQRMPAMLGKGSAPLKDVFFVALSADNSVITMVTTASSSEAASDQARDQLSLTTGKKANVLHTFRYEGGTVTVSRSETFTTNA